MSLKKANSKKQIVKNYYNNSFLSELLMSNKYYYNIVEDSYMNKVGFLKIRSEILKKIRFLFLKKIRMNFFNKHLRIRSEKTDSFFNFVKFFSSLKKLKIFFYLITAVFLEPSKGKSFFKKFNDLHLVQKESISFFRNRKKNSLAQNPF